jgi:hypothetical protein
MLEIGDVRAVVRALKLCNHGKEPDANEFLKVRHHESTAKDKTFGNRVAFCNYLVIREKARGA